MHTFPDGTVLMNPDSAFREADHGELVTRAHLVLRMDEPTPRGRRPLHELAATNRAWESGGAHFEHVLDEVQTREGALARPWTHTR